MAYFKQNEPYPKETYEPEEDTYDDGFDELTEEEEEIPELTEEEKSERRDNRFRLAVGAGNLVAIIGGTLMILLMLTMIISIIYFVINDMGRNFSLFQTKF